MDVDIKVGPLGLVVTLDRDGYVDEILHDGTGDPVAHLFNQTTLSLIESTARVKANEIYESLRADQIISQAEAA